ncbi:Hypothetical protein R9X50_00428600 [Acrodontium crateriforme]|uniref:FHA domain-containing protein n=1 Tax=Acrodontium crateriforme TaxID=150365 RepID=A0AAQ3RAM6_9PEZI|nr:Hypothetical protein R9X50_00428600 [Acrodontium crateriforme]
MSQLPFQLVLTDVNNPSDTRHINLSQQNPTVTIGRASKTQAKNLAPNPDNALFNCPVISRNHAELRLTDNAIYVVDTKSLHGTAVNDVRLAPHVPFTLYSGDVIKLGDEVVRFSDKHTGILLKISQIGPLATSSINPTYQASSVGSKRGYHLPSSSEDESDEEVSDAEYDISQEECEHVSSNNTTPEQLKTVPGSREQPIDIEVTPSRSVGNLINLDDDVVLEGAANLESSLSSLSSHCTSNSMRSLHDDNSDDGEDNDDEIEEQSEASEDEDRYKVSVSEVPQDDADTAGDEQEGLESSEDEYGYDDREDLFEINESRQAYDLTAFSDDDSEVEPADYMYDNDDEGPEEMPSTIPVPFLVRAAYDPIRESQPRIANFSQIKPTGYTRWDIPPAPAQPISQGQHNDISSPRPLFEPNTQATPSRSHSQHDYLSKQDSSLVCSPAPSVWPDSTHLNCHDLCLLNPSCSPQQSHALGNHTAVAKKGIKIDDIVDKAVHDSNASHSQVVQPHASQLAGTKRKASEISTDEPAVMTNTAFPSSVVRADAVATEPVQKQARVVRVVKEGAKYVAGGILGAFALGAFLVSPYAAFLEPSHMS